MSSDRNLFCASQNYYSQPSKDTRHFVTPVASKAGKSTRERRIVYFFIFCCLYWAVHWLLREKTEVKANKSRYVGGSVLACFDCRPRNGFFFYSYLKKKIVKFQTIDEPRHYFHCLFKLGVGPEHFCFLVRNVTSTTEAK